MVVGVKYLTCLLLAIVAQVNSFPWGTLPLPNEASSVRLEDVTEPHTSFTPTG